MRIRDAGIMARRLLNQHQLHLWRLVWTEWHATVGRCERVHRVIYLSRPFFQLNDEAHLRDVVLHEIAHALTAGDHNEAWRELFIRIGGSGVVSPYLISPQWRLHSHKQPLVRRAVDILVDDPLDWPSDPVV